MLPHLSKATKLDHSIGRLPRRTRSRAICIRICSFTNISDLAALFYLSRLVTPGYRIFDFGGNTGVLFYSWHPRHRIKADVGFLLERG